MTAPDDGLSTLRKQINRTSALAAALFPVSLLLMIMLALFGSDIAVIGIMVVVTTLFASLMLSLTVKVLYSIRGGTLLNIDLIKMLFEFWLLLPAAVTSVLLLVLTIQGSIS